MIEPTAALAPLPQTYHRLFERVLQLAEPDQRIRGLWLSGSLARGEADAGSDLDLLLAIADDDFDDFVANWRDWVAQLGEPLLALQIPRSKLIFTVLTDRLCRLDAVVEPVSKLPESPHRRRIPVIDRDDLDRLVPLPAPGPGPNPDKITMIIEEFWRQQAIFPAMVDGRGDLLCALTGVQNAAQMLYDVFVESNQPLPPMGVKQFSRRLTEDQRRVLEELPAVGPDRELLIIADAAVRRAMADAGRDAAERVGARYPERLADAVTGQLGDDF
ncbi:nucleotidyltransferase domain-containing protein [Microlunatus elymi]|uniref:Nucleotidyltransferase domain-containing protein n=1 Tax=Microlunatus elymi TaxID=2596828 RepID=A0A516Q1S9_9ACTN|nr:aminoglycoside 6-adenylyltransferase [Microlunatus elymi]QDP97358.1 nucleotidyltransferase domain-containing protein [Microlunatus elymi]